MATTITNSEIPQWKKDLIARLRNQNKKTEERLWNDHHHHRNLVYPSHSSSEENGFNNKEVDSSSSSSDSEDLHYGPGIVNRLKNKYLSLALRESNKSRPTILRKATSLENLLDDNDDDVDDDDGGEIIGGKNNEEKHDFIKRSTNGIGMGNRFRSITRRQEMKRARSVEIISRINHDDDDDDDQNENDELISMTASVTAKINNRQSLHEDIFNNKHNNNEEIIGNNSRNLNTKNNGTEDIGKFTSRLNRPKRIPQLLNEREKPPVDVVKHTKMIFEKRPESRTKKPPHTGDVAAKVDSFNDIIVKTKVALKSAKPVIKTTKPVLNDNKINTLNRFRTSSTTTTVTKSINEEILKPKTLDLNNKGDNNNKQFNSLPSPIPDVSRVGIKHQDNDSRRNSKSSLCETPDLLLTTNNIPIPNKFSSPPNYMQRNTEDFLVEERNRSISSHTEATNIFIYSQIQKDSDSTAKEDPVFQESSTSSSSSSQLAVYNFLNAQIDQRHLPLINNDESEDSSLNHCNKTTTKIGLSAFEIERNLKNAAKDVEDIQQQQQQQQQKSEFNNEKAVYKKPIFDLVSNTNIISEINNVVVPAEVNNKQQNNKHVQNSEKLNKTKIISVNSEENKIVFTTKKPPKSAAKIDESSSCSVFNFTSRKDVPDYISNDTSRSPNKWTIPKPDEPGVKLLPDAILSNFKEVQEVLEENELIKCLEARPPSPCDVTFINDNILIDGKSSLIQHSKRLKMKITFVDEAEIYEYPSEISLILDDSSAQLGHTIPQLSGSSLASYTPKTTEDFQLGVTKSFNSSSSSELLLMNNLKTEEIIPQQSAENNLLLEEVDAPILFSSGSTSDILF